MRDVVLGKSSQRSAEIHVNGITIVLQEEANPQTWKDASDSFPQDMELSIDAFIEITKEQKRDYARWNSKYDFTVTSMVIFHNL